MEAYLGQAYQRYTPRKPRMKTESIMLVGGAIALVAIVTFVKGRKPKRKRK